MRFAIISDIHGNIAALEAVLADIESRGVDGIANLGDLLSGPFDAAATANRLMGLNLPTVSGNHDRALWDRPRADMGLWEEWVIDDLTTTQIEWLKDLPNTLELGKIFLCHATPERDDDDWLDKRGGESRPIPRDRNEVLERLGRIRSPVVCCGHTHTPRIVRMRGQLIVNPGSVGCPAYFDSRFDPPFIHQTGASDARYAIVEQQNGIWRADLLAVPYDSREMVRLARDKGADTWADAVETGWVT